MRNLVVLLTLLLGLPLAGLSSPASAGGIALNWSNCVADGGLSNVAFACNTNAGFAALVPSFTLDEPLNGVASVAGTVKVAFDAATLPAWWEFESCRNGSLSALNEAIGPAICPFWSAPFVIQNGINSYTTGTDGPNSARIEFTSRFTGSSRNLTAGSEQIVTALRINFNRTVGTPSCAGCGIGACMTLSQLTFRALNGVPILTLTVPVSPGGALATWQGGGQGPGGICEFSTSARRSAWGAIKSLYR